MYTPIRRIGRARGRLMSLARWAPADRVPVAELEFEGGPLDGRCMTGLTCFGDLHVVGRGPDGAPRLDCGPVRRDPLGTYRLTRRYDCPRRVERVYVYRWSPADPVR